MLELCIASYSFSAVSRPTEDADVPSYSLASKTVTNIPEGSACDKHDECASNICETYYLDRCSNGQTEKNSNNKADCNSNDECAEGYVCGTSSDVGCQEGVTGDSCTDDCECAPEWWCHGGKCVVGYGQSNHFGRDTWRRKASGHDSDCAQYFCKCGNDDSGAPLNYNYNCGGSGCISGWSIMGGDGDKGPQGRLSSDAQQ